MPAPGCQLEHSALKRALGRTLPAYMVPASYVVLPELPLTPSAKVDRRALPDPDTRRPELSQAYLAPRSGTEEVLASIWRDVLGVDRVGVHDDFFDLGGDSLSTVQVAARARARGVAVSVRDLIENPTVAQLAAVTLARAGGAAGPEVSGPVVSGPVVSGTVLVRLREGTGRPLYCVHPTGGSVTWYRPLARALRGQRPVLAFQARGLAGGVDPVRIDELAAGYVAELKARDGDGPHAVFGWSMGANIAFEMARLAGDIDPLMLAEPAIPTAAMQRKLASVVALLETARDLSGAIKNLPAGSQARPALGADLRRTLLAAGMVPGEIDLGPDAPIDVWHSLLKAMATFKLGPAPVTFT